MKITTLCCKNSIIQSNLRIGSITKTKLHKMWKQTHWRNIFFFFHKICIEKLKKFRRTFSKSTFWKIFNLNLHRKACNVNLNLCVWQQYVSGNKCLTLYGSIWIQIKYTKTLQSGKKKNQIFLNLIYWCPKQFSHLPILTPFL